MKGSTISFALDVKLGTEPSTENDLPDATRNGRECDGMDFAARFPHRILVAEDSKMNQILIRRLLEDLGYRVDQAQNGEECIEMLRSNRYTFVLMDMKMPIMDGQTATRRIRAGAAGEDNRNLKIAAMTANVLKQDRAECRNAGMDTFIANRLR